VSVTVRIPAAMRHLTGGLSEVAASGETLEALLASLEATHPGIQRAVCDERGGLLRFVAVFVDGLDARTLQGLATPVPPDGEVDIVSAIAGG
jgi:sulfur-carrier protein